MTLPPEIADLTPVPEPDAGGNVSPGVESPPPVVSPADETPSVAFEDLTLGLAVGQLFRSPGATFPLVRLSRLSVRYFAGMNNRNLCCPFPQPLFLTGALQPRQVLCCHPLALKLLKPFP